MIARPLPETVLGALRGAMTVEVLARHVRASEREVLDELNALRASGQVIRRVGDPSLPPHLDRPVARWSRA